MDKKQDPPSRTKLNGNEIVITGIAGCFPNAENTEKLKENLYNKTDMVKKFKDFENIKHLEVPKYVGKIEGLEKFDAQFFRVSQWQVNSLDPVGRKLLELTFSAIFDAGINPETLKDKKMGVFIGSLQSDASYLNLYYIFKRHGFIMPGSSKSMFANRISYWVDGKGPSFSLDNGCAVSMAALEMAYKGMKTGEIDCAIVGGCSFCIVPTLNMNMKRAGLLCLDGKTKCFDNNGDGYSKSDAVSVCFLQKAIDAKRIYSEVIHVKGSYFASPDGSFSMKRNPKQLEKFFEEFYLETDVSPYDVEYVEANAFGIAEADGNELEAIGNIFCKNKSIKIGSVKSNMGNTEGASGVCSITKMCLAYQNGLIPANLHYNEPQNHIAAVKEGRLQVVTENEPFNRGYTAINNFCYTGANFHALLKGYYKPKDNRRYKSTIPRLVLVSGRQEDSVNKVFDHLENKPIDAEQCALLDNIFKYDIRGHTGRGYCLLDSKENNKTESLSRSFEFYSGKPQPVWFLYSGMGSQWGGMGAGLLRLPAFAAAIERCHKVLQPKGLDIRNIITNKDSNTLNVLTTLVAITAIQIGLTDVLKSLGIEPDKIIGHSVGELGCAYADGALTAEETILASYCRAIVSYETQFIKGKMAAIGLGCNEVGKVCPPEIEVACHNSSKSTTISGPADKVTEFVAGLKAQDIFAKEVNSYDIAFHSKYIDKVGPKMLELHKEFITKPKLRSNKWPSTCFLPQDWEKPESKYASGEYFTHNMMGCVYFEEAARLIPHDAIILEIAPHGLLQAIMKRSHSQCINLSLTRRGENDSVKFLLDVIGKLYQNGLNPNISVLYPTIEFPVSSETPLMSHLIGWDHTADWSNDMYSFDILNAKKSTATKEIIISTHDDEYSFLRGYVRNGVNVLPEAALIVFVWEILIEHEGHTNKDVKVIFENVKFYNELIIKPEELFRLVVTILTGSKRFEVTNENKVIADGFIHTSNYIGKNKIGENFFHSGNENEHLNQSDIYTLLSIRGYSYGYEFKNIMSTNIKRNKANVRWNDQWVTFLDALIQLNALSRDFEGVTSVRLINKLTINTDLHSKFRIKTTNGEHVYNALVLENIGKTTCPGVIFEDIVYNEIPKSEHLQQVLYTRKFFTHMPTCKVDIRTALLTNLQVLNENVSGSCINIIDTTNLKTNISNTIKEEAEKIPLLNVKMQSKDINFRDTILRKDTDLKADVLIVANFWENDKLVEAVLKNINEKTYILAIETKIMREEKLALKHLKTITLMQTDNQTFILMKKTIVINPRNTIVLPFQLNNAMNIHKLKSEHREKDLIFVVENRQHYIEKDIINVLKRYENVYLYILNENSQKFSVTNPYFRNQIEKGLKVNIMLDNGQWGSISYIPANLRYVNKIMNVQLIPKEPYNIESLTWIEAPATMNKQTIQVSYSGLSMKDIRKVSDPDGNKCFGMDFSGIDSSGNRVMGLLPHGGIASTVEADYDLLWPVPQHWSLQEAATVPMPYIHAFYCFTKRCSMYKNSTVFITGAAGAFGQAVIAVAHSLNCTVYGTVSNADKKKFLLKLFPNLDGDNIACTNDASFYNMILSRTDNRGCDIVINCLSGERRKTAMECAGFMKYFLDVNNTDMKNNELLDMFSLRKDRCYKAVNLSNIFDENSRKIKKDLQVMLSEGIAKGFVRPITSVVYTPMNITRAFQLLFYKKNKGRVLINMKDSRMQSDNLDILPRLTLDSNNSYIVVCDGTTPSVELIDRLVQRGARRFLIHINQKLFNGYFQVRYSLWLSLGVEIEFSSIDLHTEINCQIVLKNANKLGPVDGIFMTYNDLPEKSSTVLINQENVDTGLIVSNLDKACQKISKLRYFAIIAVTTRNVSNENTLENIEKCCILRNQQNLPSLFLRHIVNNETLQAKSLSTLFNAMESSLNQEYVIVLSSDLNHKESNKIVKSEANSIGLKVFISHIPEDEMIASEPIVHMQTKSRLSSQHELLMDPDDTYLLMIPGLEGNYKILTSISERLKIPALALQPCDIVDTFPEMAKNLLNYVKMRIRLKSPFYLMGYSFGVNIALELAALLEAEGQVGVIICLDSSPDTMRVHLDTYLGNLTDEQLQNSLISHFYKLLAGEESTDLKEITDKITKWSDKINMLVNKVKNLTAHSHQFLATFTQGVYNKIKLAREYRLNYKLNSELILIKGVNHPNAEQLGDDYNLSKYTSKTVKVYAIEANHASAPMDSKVSNFINRAFV